MEQAPNEDMADLGYIEGKISDNVYVHAGNDNGDPDLQFPATPTISLEINILEVPSPKVRDISYVERNEAKIDKGYNSKGHSRPHVLNFKVDECMICSS